MKLEEENKIQLTDNYALLNTGLFTSFYEAIYAYFTPNANPNRQKWFLDGFYTSYQLAMMGITAFPERANYFADPSAMVFDTNCDIIPQYQHIFNDPENFLRIPEVIRESPNKSMLFDGAIKRAKLMIDANCKTAVPQYYKGRIQLLIPIRIISCFAYYLFYFGRAFIALPFYFHFSYYMKKKSLDMCKTLPAPMRCT